MQNACQIITIIIVIIQKIINYSIIYIFLIDIKNGLYPYLDINNSFYSNIISTKAVFFKLFCSLIGLASGTLLILFVFCICKLNIINLSRNCLVLLLLISSIEITFLYSRFLEIRSISYLVENCEFANQVQVGCYVPPEKL